jgi:hypothetical protein
MFCHLIGEDKMSKHVTYAEGMRNAYRIFYQVSQRKEATLSAWEMGCEHFDWLYLALDIEHNSKSSRG